MNEIIKKNLTIVGAGFAVVVLAATQIEPIYKSETKTETVEVKEDKREKEVEEVVKEETETTNEEIYVPEDYYFDISEIPEGFEDLEFVEDEEIEENWENMQEDTKVYVQNLDNGLTDAENYYLLKYAYEQAAVNGEMYTNFNDFANSDAMNVLNETIKQQVKDATKEIAREAAKEATEVVKEEAKAYWEENGDEIKAQAKKEATEFADEYVASHKEEWKADMKEVMDDAISDALKKAGIGQK